MIGSYRMFIQDISHSDQTKSPTANEMVRRTTAYIDTANIWCYMKYKFISLIKKIFLGVHRVDRPDGVRVHVDQRLVI